MQLELLANFLVEKYNISFILKGHNTTRIVLVFHLAPDIGKRTLTKN